MIIVRVNLTLSFPHNIPSSVTEMKWLFQGRDVNNDNTAVRTLQSLCSASVHFLAPHYIYKEINLFSCEVTKGHNLHVSLLPSDFR